MTKMFATILLFGALLTQHPMIMVSTLILQTICLMTIMYSITPSSWVLYMLFLIFLGGLLIIFVYLCALVPNEMFKKLFNMEHTLTLAALPLIMFYGLTNEKNLSPSSSESSTPFVMASSNAHLNLLLMMVYLLVGLLIIMSMTKKIKTPLKINTYEHS